MTIKFFYPDVDGKITFTKEQLERLINEVYEEGRKDGQNYWPHWNTWTYTTDTANPHWNIWTYTTDTAKIDAKTSPCTITFNKSSEQE